MSYMDMISSLIFYELSLRQQDFVFTFAMIGLMIGARHPEEQHRKKCRGLGAIFSD